jgi:hypothetical protein
MQAEGFGIAQGSEEALLLHWLRLFHWLRLSFFMLFMLMAFALVLMIATLSLFVLVGLAPLIMLAALTLLATLIVLAALVLPLMAALLMFRRHNYLHSPWNYHSQTTWSMSAKRDNSLAIL